MMFASSEVACISDEILKGMKWKVLVCFVADAVCSAASGPIWFLGSKLNIPVVSAGGLRSSLPWNTGFQGRTGGVVWDVGPHDLFSKWGGECIGDEYLYVWRRLPCEIKPSVWRVRLEFNSDVVPRLSKWCGFVLTYLILWYSHLKRYLLDPVILSLWDEVLSTNTGSSVSNNEPDRVHAKRMRRYSWHLKEQMSIVG